MINKLRQLGQGMTEYIIIVALIAIAAIAVYGFFGDAIRGQVGATQEPAGQEGQMGTVESTAGPVTDEQGNLGTYGQ